MVNAVNTLGVLMMSNEKEFDGSAMCTCGHTLEDHHKWWLSDGSLFVDECEFYGFNESGGMMPGPNENDSWVEHCQKFVLA